MELMRRLQNSFLTNVSKKNGCVYFSDNIDIELVEEPEIQKLEKSYRKVAEF